MKRLYPVTLFPYSDYVVVYVPDLDINTEGTDMQDAIFMAGDAISLCCIDREDSGIPVPEPSRIEDIAPEEGATKALAEDDLAEYRRLLEAAEAAAAADLL